MLVPVPCVYPEVPYSKFHALSVAPAVQLTSAPSTRIFDETIPVGAVQDGVSWIETSSIAISS